MRNATELMVQYAAYHRDRRNIATRFAGIPLIVFAIGALILLGQQVAGGSVASWLSLGVGTFVIGWVLQFIGHYYEGRKPAFVDDVIGLLVGPMFVVGELLFALGWGKPLLAEIEQRVGPTTIRDLRQRVA